MVRAGHLERRLGDLRCARQRRRRARVRQPRPAPHQRDEEQLRLRIQVERQHGAVALGRGRARGGFRVGRRGPGRPPVASRDRDRDLQPVVEHGAGADHRRARVDKPAAGRVPVALHPRQPDPVSVARHVQGVRPADVGDPGPLRCRLDDPGTPGQSTPSGNCQVYLWPSPEYQLAAFGEPEDLAGRGTDVRGHRASVGTWVPSGAPPDSGMAPRFAMRLAPDGEAPDAVLGTARKGRPVPEGGDQVHWSWGDPVRWSPAPGVSPRTGGIRLPVGAAARGVRMTRGGARAAAHAPSLSVWPAGKPPAGHSRACGETGPHEAVTDGGEGDLPVACPLACESLSKAYVLLCL